VALWAVVACLPLLIIFAGPAAAHRLWPDKVILNGSPGPAGWIPMAWPLAVVAILIPFALWMGRAPGFAVLPEGIKVPIKRVSPDRSTWDPWSCGFYSWSEVGRCGWSPHQPGVLAIHLGAVDHQVPVIFGMPPGGRMKTPPMIYFYRVPERHRAAVEAAIRSCGQWAD
jgi:hypothetical protein